MVFATGVAVGLAAAAALLACLAYFRSARRTVDRIVREGMRGLEFAGGERKGSIIMPKTEQQAARERIIEENDKAGRDTPLADLMSE